MASFSRSSMELIFMLTSWIFAQEGSKATQFDVVCRALGVQFDFSKSEAGLMAVCNTEAWRQELIQQITAALKTGETGDFILEFPPGICGQFLAWACRKTGVETLGGPCLRSHQKV